MEGEAVPPLPRRPLGWGRATRLAPRRIALFPAGDLLHSQAMSQTPFYPFVNRRDRTNITYEPDSRGSKKTPLNPGIDWIGFQDRGGGTVPPLFWPTNPKQYQEENGVGTMNYVERKKLP